MQKVKALIKAILSILQAKRFERTLRSGKLNGQLLILMYHRVLPKSDPRLENEEPGMYVTPETLNMHVNELKRFAKLVHIEEWQALAAQATLEDTLYCAITFDDGWADNFEYGLPVLKKHQAPSTVFLATDYIDSNTTFWPERLASLINNNSNNQSDLKVFFKKLGTDIDFKKLQTSGPQEKKDYVSSLIQIAKQLTEEEIQTWLNTVETPSKPQQREMLTWNEVKQMKAAGVRIGGHTRSHLRLNDKATEKQIRKEVVGCYEDIEQHLGVNPTQFCYPNGDCSAIAESIVAQTFQIAVTTEIGINAAHKNRLKMGRIGMHEDVCRTEISFRSRIFKAFQNI